MTHLDNEIKKDYYFPMSGFTKLWSSIIHSTVWGEAPHTKIVWITLLAMADRKGKVCASIPGLAHAARVTLEQTEEALERLRAPDPYSRTKRHEGRRIQDIEGGWLLLNYEEQRNKRADEERTLQVREAVRKFREKKKSHVITSNHENQPEAEAEAEAEEAEADKPTRGRMRFSKPSSEEVQEYLQSLGEKRFTGQQFFDGNEAKGWVVGKFQTPMKSWRHAVRTWITNRNEQEKKSGKSNAPEQTTSIRDNTTTGMREEYNIETGEVIAQWKMKW